MCVPLNIKIHLNRTKRISPVASNTNLIYHEICQASYRGPWSSEFARFERVGSSVVLLSVVEVVEVLVVVLLSVNALFLL